ncbi:hypothetical protein N836_26555 [Leptolyngbya sp. Heron Island J]|uniref:hypothetical protein n=1 Tax=Leptolyngbya sp. Heron Island J TaxID=1385935 RepID=UPI0003B9A29D|nr:hypothetical protein [Leptolyngbya sp. Heron Island J]ESA32155.1 hypothetical protein N836_26555 [Leptolyngbya sp. Heron Island J]
MTAWVYVLGKVIRGHGVASGQAKDPRFPEGTLQMQVPMFAAQGLCLDAYFPGTINVSIHPKHYTVRQARHRFRQVKWAENAPPEDFSFFDCRVVLDTAQRLPGLIYYPHPETKPEHFQDPATLEVLAPFIRGLSYGMTLGLELDPKQLTLE